MISRKFIFSFVICLILLFVLFYIFPQYLKPAEQSTDNYIYVNNILNKGIFTFDKFSEQRYDDSKNFLFVAALYSVVKTLQCSVYQASIIISAISLFFSIFFLFRIVSSRFQSVNILIVLSMFLSTQLWSGLLGDEVLFNGLILILAIRSFWKHRYSWLLIWTVVNAMCNFYTLFYLFPLILVSYRDVLDLKKRNRAKFLMSRMRKTFLFFIIPFAFYCFYRKLYFGKIIPYHWHSDSFLNEEKDWLFYKSSILTAIRYLRYFLMPLVIGVIFYLIKQRKKINIRYYALIVGLIIIPIIYQSTIMQDENFGYKNYYVVYIAFVTITILFIRDFRSLSQQIAMYAFILFFGFKTFKSYSISTVQFGKSNVYALAIEIDTVKNGKMALYYDNYFSWLSEEWDIVFLNNRHTILPIKTYEQIDYTSIDADIIFPFKLIGDEYQNKYQLFQLPVSTRQYEKEVSSTVLVDKLMQRLINKMPIDDMQQINVLVWKYSGNYKQMQQLLLKYGATEIVE